MFPKRSSQDPTSSALLIFSVHYSIIDELPTSSSMLFTPFSRVITYFVLLQQLLITVKSLSRNYLRFQSKLLSTVTDSPTFPIVGEKSLENTKFDKRNIEFTVVNSAILSVSLT